LPGSGALEHFGTPSSRTGDPPASSAGVRRVADQRVSDMLQVDPDLVGSPGMQLDPEQIRYLEPSDHGGIGPGHSPKR